MSNLSYTFKTLIRGKGSNVIKTISLTLGFSISVILFARVAFEMSFDSHYQEADRLYAIQATYYISGNDGVTYPIVMGAVPGAVGENFPDVVESATVVHYWPEQRNIFFNGEHRFQPQVAFTDTLYFRTMGLNILSGDPGELGNPDVLFLSESFAGKVFGDESPIGKVLLYKKQLPMTVKGIYEDIPENTTVRHDIVVSMPTLLKYGWGHLSWDGGDNFRGYVRVRKHTDIESLTKRINVLAQQHAPFRPELGFALEYSLIPVRDLYRDQAEVRRMNILLFMLGFSLLFVAAMNYILISVSSLYKRAKAVGVHKCSGATGREIFVMFLQETAILLGISLILTWILLFNFREPVEDLIGFSLGALFNLRTSWLPVCVIGLLFLLAGILPGKIFSDIPVTQVFRRYTEGKSTWKRPLLFVEFAGMAFIFGLMCTIMLQYQQIMNKDLGYNPGPLAVVNHDFPDAETGRSLLKRLPMVEGVGISWFSPVTGYAGDGVTTESGFRLFTVNRNEIDYNYLSISGIDLAEGRNVQSEEEILVNEEFVRRMGWTDGAIGRSVYKREYCYGTIVGVMRDFAFSSLYDPIGPVLFTANNNLQGVYTVKLKEPFSDNLRALNREMKEMFPTHDIIFKSLRAELDDLYISVKRFRDSVIIASVAILLIALMGLFGYINEEIRRRSKEIAIRKVNGAKASDILSLLSHNILWTALVAVSLGTVLAYYIGEKWLEQFSEKISHTLVLYALLIIVLNLLIHLGVMFRSWEIANENPVDSIKNE